jgi:two-component system, NtrC family, sensor kinase
LQPKSPLLTQTRLPKIVVWGIVLICVLPLLLNLLGVSFTSPNVDIDFQTISNLSNPKITDYLHRHLAGSFTHTILEWSAVCVAIFTVILSFIYFHIQKDVTTPVIGLALFFAGLMDAFHTLAADRLIYSVGDQQNLIPLTWAICRLFNAVITICGVSIFLFFKKQKFWRSFRGIIGIGLLFGIIASVIIYICLNTDNLPVTIHPHALISRPWDLIPLMVFLLAGLVIYPKFDKQYPSLFSHALIISTIPNAVTQLYMVFGSSALFDNAFNVAHFIKIIAYFVPLMGLILDYKYTHKELNIEIIKHKKSVLALQESENLFKDKNIELESTLTKLKQTQSQLIQAEKMSSLGQMVAGIAHEINNPVNFIHGNINYLEEYVTNLLKLVTIYEEEYPQKNHKIQQEMEVIELDFLKEDTPKMIHSIKIGTQRIRDLVISLRNFSRLDEADLKAVDLYEGIDNTLLILNNRIKKGIKLIKNYGKIGQIECYPAQLNQVWMNILTNSIDAIEQKKRQSDILTYTPTIIIDIKSLDSQHIEIKIRDNGFGLPEEIKAKIFDPFFTTKPIGKGTGLGLSIVYQIIDKHHGKIKVNSAQGEFTEFIITLPIKISEKS